MATTRKPTPPPRKRDHSREGAGRATSEQVKFAFTPDERQLLDALATRLGATSKASVLGALRAALALLEGQGAPAARKILLADLAPTKPGPKPVEPHE